MSKPRVYEATPPRPPFPDTPLDWPSSYFGRGWTRSRGQDKAASHSSAEHAADENWGSTHKAREQYKNKLQTASAAVV